MANFLVKAGILKDTSKGQVPTPCIPATGKTKNPDSIPTIKVKRVNVSQDRIDSDKDIVPTGNARKDLLKLLTKAMDDASTEKFDYLKFREILDSMEKHVPDEEARFNAANATAETMKMSPSDLVDSAQDFVKVLDGEEDKFNEAMADTTKDVAQKQKQLQTVTKQLADLQEQKDSLEKDIADSTSEVTKNKADFQAAYDQIAGGIKQDISKIKKYLGK